MNTTDVSNLPPLQRLLHILLILLSSLTLILSRQNTRYPALIYHCNTWPYSKMPRTRSHHAHVAAGRRRWDAWGRYCLLAPYFTVMTHCRVSYSLKLNLNLQTYQSGGIALTLCQSAPRLLPLPLPFSGAAYSLCATTGLLIPLFSELLARDGGVQWEQGPLMGEEEPEQKGLNTAGAFMLCITVEEMRTTCPNGLQVFLYEV